MKIKSHKILNIQEIYIGQQKNVTFNLVSPFSTDKAIFGIKIQLEKHSKQLNTQFHTEKKYSSNMEVLKTAALILKSKTLQRTENRAPKFNFSRLSHSSMEHLPSIV